MEDSPEIIGRLPRNTGEMPGVQREADVAAPRVKPMPAEPKRLGEAGPIIPRATVKSQRGALGNNPLGCDRLRPWEPSNGKQDPKNCDGRVEDRCRSYHPPRRANGCDVSSDLGLSFLGGASAPPQVYSAQAVS